MRRILASGLGLSLALFSSRAAAGETAAPSTGLRTIATNVPPAPAVTLGRPVAARLGAPLPASPRATITPVSYQTAPLGAPSAIIRAQQADEVPQPLPLGPTADAKGPKLSEDRGALKIIAAQKTEIAAPKNESVQPLPVPRTVPEGSGPIIVDGAPATISGENCGCGTCGIEGCVMENECGCLCPPRFWWASAEYLLWGVKKGQAPALLTTSLPGANGIIGMPSTAVVLDGQTLDNQVRSGGRFSGGFWFGENKHLGMDASFFFLGERASQFSTSSSGLPLLARPFFDVSPKIPGSPRENSELVAAPGVLAGTFTATTSSKLWGAEANFRTNPWCGPICRWDLIGGFRYAELDESLGITESLALIPTAVAPNGAGFLITDNFSTRNTFYGGQIGSEVELRHGGWYFNILTKVALGSMHQLVEINGSTTLLVPGVAPTTTPGGLLAQPTNMGRYTRDVLAVVPEVGLKLGYHVTPHLRLFVGYNFLYMSNVVRPGDQIDRTVNSSQLARSTASNPLTGQPSPMFAFHGTDFWAQGVSFGLEFQF